MLKQIFDFIKGFAILCVFYFIGFWITKTFNLMLPAAILGLILFASALISGIIKEEWIKSTSDFLIKNMSMFIVPLMAGLIVYKSLLLKNWLVILLVIFITTTLIIVSIGLFVEYGLKLLKIYKRKKLK